MAGVSMPQRRSHITSAYSRSSNHPTFSSSLLGSIYRSMDESDSDPPRRSRDSISKHKLSYAISDSQRSNLPNLFQSGQKRSSDSSYRFSSSEADSCSSRSSRFSNETPKSILKGSFLHSEQNSKIDRLKCRSANPKNQSKKLKQPASPMKRIANFVNSLFISMKKKNHCFMYSNPQGERSANTSDRSIPSMFLHRREESSISGKAGVMKRNVRFSPVSVVIDNDFCSNERKPERDFGFVLRNDPPWEDDDSAGSCSSSDLFELDHMIFSCQQELPLYETTNLKMNQAISRAVA